MNANSPLGRPFVVFAVFFLLGGYFLFNLFRHQVLQHDEYAKAAEDQSTSIQADPAPRGQIFAQDKDGKLYSLAVSDWRYDLEISPRQVRDKMKLLTQLKKDLPDLSIDDVYSKINNDKLYVPPVLKGVDPDAAVIVQQKGYAGVFLQPVLQRVYPEGSNIAAQVVGFVGGDGTGKYGVEASHNKELQGKSGSETAKRDSLGRLIDILSAKQTQAGSDAVLTLDYNLQFTVENKLKDAIQKYQADSGSIVVMNPKTGAILAMAGQPTFDPNSYQQVPASQQLSFLSPASSSIYEPGSVFKPLTMSMGIDLGLITPDTVYAPGQSVTVNGHQIFNANNKNFGTQTARQALDNSDNVWLTHLSSLIGPDKEREYLDKFGIGKKSGLDLAGEQGGRLPPKQEWNDLLRSTASFGQGVSTTVVGLASAYSVLANGGTTVTPHLVDHFVSDGQSQAADVPASGNRVISVDTASKVRDMLSEVVNIGEGKRAKVDGVQVAGKTGTAQVADPNGGYSTTNEIGSFAGMFPASDPRFVMVVRLDNPKTVKFAESSAAPTFGEIANWMTNYYGLR